MDIEFLPLQDALAGEYSFERELGRGGMGIVYLARDVQLDRPVAIKLLPAALAARDDVRVRFLREARTAASLSHPNIVPIHRVGELAGIPFFVMTFVEGPTLGERLRDRGPASASAVLQILRDVAQALGYAHSRGIVHRDIKPDNILLDTATGRAMVTDFGIAAIAGESSEGPVSGTVGFISPEQAAGGPVDGRSDLYSLGVVAHLALTGTLPGGEVAPALPSASGASPSLATAIERCLSPDPNRRFADAESLVAALDTTTAVARSSLPPELRAWAGDQVPLLPLYGFLSFTALSTAIMTSVAGLAGVAPALVSLGLGTLPAIPVLLYQLRKTRRALAEGYRISDLRFALRAWRAERLAEIDRGSRQTSAARVASAIPLISAVAYATSALTLVLDPTRPTVWTAVMVRLAGVVGITSLATLSVFGLPLVPEWLQRMVIGRARSWLWNSRVGNWLAERLAPKGGGVPLAAFRPTEMALEVAIDDLFAALPDEYRDSLRDLPAIARRLTVRATQLREMVAAVAAAGDTSTPDQAWERLKSANATQMTETVTALERLRIGLLRLHGGLADIRPVTTALEAARAIDRDMGRLVDGQAEVSGLRRALSFERRSPSPA